MGLNGVASRNAAAVSGHNIFAFGMVFMPFILQNEFPSHMSNDIPFPLHYTLTHTHTQFKYSTWTKAKRMLQ